jgi:phage/plasmid-associated DNA primase
MKHIQKFNEEFFFPEEEMENQDSPRTFRKFDKSETGAYRALQKLRSDLDLAIDLLDKQIATKEAHPNVLQDVVEKTEEYNRFIKSIIGPQ